MSEFIEMISKINGWELFVLMMICGGVARLLNGFYEMLYSLWYPDQYLEIKLEKIKKETNEKDDE